MPDSTRQRVPVLGRLSELPGGPGVGGDGSSPPFPQACLGHAHWVAGGVLTGAVLAESGTGGVRLGP